MEEGRKGRKRREGREGKGWKGESRGRASVLSSLRRWRGDDPRLSAVAKLAKPGPGRASYLEPVDYSVLWKLLSISIPDLLPRHRPRAFVPSAQAVGVTACMVVMD